MTTTVVDPTRTKIEFAFKGVENEVLTKRMLSCIIPIRSEDKENVLNNLQKNKSNYQLDISPENGMARIFFSELNFGILNFANPNDVNLAIYISEKRENENISDMILSWLDKIGFEINYIPEKRDFIIVIHAGDPVHELKWLEKYYLDVIKTHLFFTDEFTTLGGADSVAFFLKASKPYLLNLRNFIRKDEKGVYHLIIEFIAGIKSPETKIEIKETIQDAGKMLEEKFIAYMQNLRKSYKT